MADEADRRAGPAALSVPDLDSVSWRGPIITDEEQQRRDEYLPREEGNLEQVREGLGKLAQPRVPPSGQRRRNWTATSAS